MVFMLPYIVPGVVRLEFDQSESVAVAWRDAGTGDAPFLEASGIGSFSRSPWLGMSTSCRKGVTRLSARGDPHGSTRTAAPGPVTHQETGVG